jgi:hypothetical protein
MLTFDVSGECVCEVVKATPKVEQEGGGISWDVELARNVENEVEAELLLSVFPNAVQQYLRAIDGNANSVAKVSSFAVTQLFMRTHGGDELVANASCEVRSLEFKCSAKDQVYTMKIRLKYLKTENWVGLVQSLGEQVIVTVRSAQEDLPLKKRGPQPMPGDVVCGITEQGSEVYGVYRGEKYGEHTLADFGHTHKVTSILSIFKVRGADELHVEGPIGKYIALSESPRWGFLVDALLESAKTNPNIGSRESGYVVTDEVVAIAITNESGSKGEVA